MSRSRSIAALRQHARPLLDFVERSPLRNPQSATACDFSFGNPHDMPLSSVVGALQHHAQPLNPSWFAYKLSEPEATGPVAESLSLLTGMAVAPEDIVMTPGAFGAIAVALRALLDPGDEVLYFSPPWFFYSMLIAGAGGIPRALALPPPRFEPDLDGLREVITERTRAVIWNHPHNPSGRVYPPETLDALAAVLQERSEHFGRPIYALADEAYRRILFDGRQFHSLMARYPNTLALYTYGKTLLAPGQRIGYIALPPTMPGRAELREDLETAQFALGFAFPNALLQRALVDLEQATIDLSQLQRRRDRLVPALREQGYEAVEPEGTFYVLARSPDPDDNAFCARLAAREVYVLPGSTCELPGWFRLSLTASDDMVERALPIFASLAPLRPNRDRPNRDGPA